MNTRHVFGEHLSNIEYHKNCDMKNHIYSMYGILKVLIKVEEALVYHSNLKREKRIDACEEINLYGHSWITFSPYDEINPETDGVYDTLIYHIELSIANQLWVLERSGINVVTHASRQ